MRFILLSFCIIVLACDRQVSIEGLDKNAWVSDGNGCQGKRMEMQTLIADNLEKIKGLNQTEVTGLLGKPDKNELYKRSQKFFVYHISPSSDCDPSKGQYDKGTYLSIRFNAMGLAKEVLLLDDPSGSADPAP